jgi:hypothetical protein
MHISVPPKNSPLYIQTIFIADHATLGHILYDNITLNFSAYIYFFSFFASFTDIDECVFQEEKKKSNNKHFIE